MCVCVFSRRRALALYTCTPHSALHPPPRFGFAAAFEKNPRKTATPHHHRRAKERNDALCRSGERLITITDSYTYIHTTQANRQINRAVLSLSLLCTTYHHRRATIYLQRVCSNVASAFLTNKKSKQETIYTPLCERDRKKKKTLITIHRKRRMTKFFCFFKFNFMSFAIYVYNFYIQLALAGAREK